MRIHRLRDLYELKQVEMSGPVQEDPMLSLLPRTLVVRHTPLYKLEGEEKGHYAEALESLGIRDRITDAHIDIQGSAAPAIVIVSPAQIEAGRSDTQAYLDPVLAFAYASPAVRDFTLREAVVVRPHITIGGKDAATRPAPGEIVADVILDSPSGSVSRFITLQDKLSNLLEEPMQLLGPGLEDLVQEGIVLRQKLGSLSRYRCNSNQASIPLSSCIIGDSWYFHNGGKSAVVDFKEPRTYAVDGNSEDALSHMIRKGFFRPSEEALIQRHLAIMQIEGMESLASQIGTARKYFAEVLNDELRASYLMEHPGIAEFAVVPAFDDPLLTSLLPRISHFRIIRRYSDSGRFISDFKDASEGDRLDMLTAVSSSLLFLSYQNNEVNDYLVTDHAALLERCGFEIIPLSYKPNT